jgi:anti-sigma regulatory factor (Ser/Thr protein kinase)
MNQQVEKLTIKTTGPELDVGLVKLKQKLVESFTLDLSDIAWLNPIEVVRFKCAHRLAREMNCPARFTPPKRTDVASYARRMGLFDAAAIPSTDSQATFFPLYSVADDNNSALFDELIRVFGPEEPSVNWAGEVASALTELVDNIYYHSGVTPNSGWGYAHAQKLRNANMISIGIADVGIGYTASYRRTGQDKGRSPLQIVQDSFKLQESSLNLPGKPPHRGIGLSQVVDFINGFNGTLKLFTDNVSAELHGKGTLRVQDAGYDVCGTWISLEVPIV